MSMEIECPVHFRKARAGRKKLSRGSAPPPVAEGTIPRVSRLVAMAIRFDRLVREGQVRDYAELARVGRVSRARLTQIMNLLNLAPDIQEEILFLPRTLAGRDAVTEHDLRTVAAVVEWEGQRLGFLPVRTGKRVKTSLRPKAKRTP